VLPVFGRDLDSVRRRLAAFGDEVIARAR